MKIVLLAAAALAAAGLAGCATPETSTEAGASRDRGEFVTGSNVPRRNRDKAANDGVRVHSREDLERLQGAGHGNQPGEAR